MEVISIIGTSACIIGIVWVWRDLQKVWSQPEDERFIRLPDDSADRKT